MRLLTLNLKLFVCSLVLLVLAACDSAGGSSPESVVVGNNAPDFALSSLDGTTVKSDSLKGNVVTVNMPGPASPGDFKEFYAAILPKYGWQTAGNCWENTSAVSKM